MASLFRASCASAIGSITPGAIHGNRLVGIYEDELFLANGAGLYSVRPNYTVAGAYTDLAGAASTLAPPAVTRIATNSKHELVNVTARANSSGVVRVGAVNTFSEAFIYVQRDEPSCKRPRVFGETLPSISCTNVLVNQPRNIEAGWAGIALHADERLCATARFFDGALSVFDGDQVSRTLYTQATPNAILWMEDGSQTLAVLERTMLALYDVRADRACVMRCASSPQPLYALCTAPGGLAVGGADRSIQLIDVKKGTRISAWRAATKRAATRLHLSNVQKDLCFVTDIDNQLLTGTLDGKQSPKARVRGDGRWIGTTVVDDTLFGITTAGTLYIARNSSQLSSKE